MRRSWPALNVVLLLVTALLVACGRDGEVVVGDVDAVATTTSTSVTAIAGSVAATSASVAVPSVTTITSTPSSSSDVVGETSLDAPSVDEKDAEGLPLFTSPSGNTACSIDELYGASFWIAEKSWEVEMPTGDFCEVSDWGNAIAIDDRGVTWLCYTDFPWDPSAPTLAYGEAVGAAGFRCLSERSGLTCTNAAGSGFTLARSAVEVF